MTDYKALWNTTKEKLSLEKQISAISFDLWIKNMNFVDFKDGHLVVSSQSATAKTQIKKRHEKQIESAVSQVYGIGTTYEILDPAEAEEYLKNKEQPLVDPASLKKDQEPSPFNEKYTFDNFVVGKSNQFVYAACRNVAEHPGQRFNPLFIYGGVGLGKTHLLHAIGNYITNYFPDLKIAYVTCEKFTNDYIKSLGSSGGTRTNIEFREKYRNLDVLMIDDIQFISGKTSTQEEFFHTFNDLYQSSHQIIISSDRPPKEIATLEDRLRSRFTCGLIQDIQPPDFETKVAILQKKALQEKYNVDYEVLEFIAEKTNTNIREMEGLLSKVYFFATLIGKPIADIEVAREAFKEQAEDLKEKITAENIINKVSSYYNIPRDEMLGKKKSKEIVEPRMIAIYLISELLGLPLITIGKLFGRDHTTIIHARDKITDQMKFDSRTKTTVSDIKSMLENI